MLKYTIIFKKCNVIVLAAMMAVPTANTLPKKQGLVPGECSALSRQRSQQTLQNVEFFLGGGAKFFQAPNIFTKIILDPHYFPTPIFFRQIFFHQILISNITAISYQQNVENGQNKQFWSIEKVPKTFFNKKFFKHRFFQY